MSALQGSSPGLEKENFLATSDLNESKIRFLLKASHAFSNTNDPPPLLKGKTIVNLFFENSTRTRLSFELAAKRLGGSPLNFSANQSSLRKGESLFDTAKTIEALNPDALVVRHRSAGSPLFLSQVLNVPVINAGDGFHEHPTQALLDALTMESKLGDLRGKRVIIIGDIAHSRVARSNIHLLRKLGASVGVCGPPTLLPPHPEILGVDFSYRPEDFLAEADVVMMLRIQMERHNQMQFPSLNEYHRFWGLTPERERLLKPEAIVLHPGPINRGVEIDPEVADGPRSVILDQVSNGILVRMAVLAQLCNSSGLEDWMGIKQ